MSPSETSRSTAGTAVETPVQRSRGRLILIRALQVLLGLLVGLIATELVFRWRADSAFPHVNLYVPDAELGARLEPGSEQYFKLRNNPLTHIRINAAGYRGPELAPVDKNVQQAADRANREILVVGDSQVFGLGVEEDETFAAQLAKLTGRTVINGGVPTYGPIEYAAVIREQLARRKIGTVIYVVNFANDLFENERPNRERHAVWDGWAVRIETAPRDVAEFPGRKWLFSRSHAFYALRRWLHDEAEHVEDRGFASEGTWTDLVHTGERVAERHTEAQNLASESQAERAAKLKAVQERLQATETEIRGLLFELVPEFEGGASESALVFHAADVSPGDIVSDEYAEGGRSVRVTAAMVHASVHHRHQLIRRLAKNPKGAETKRLLQSAAEHEALQAEQIAVYSQSTQQAHVPSVLEPHLRAVQELCAAHGAELVVVALPIDVQVSAKEWAKYGVKNPIDMSPSRVLLTDLVASAEHMGVRGVDVSPALAAVQVPAFLDGDIHMTPAGHRAVAEALAAKLAEPAPVRRPEAGLPAGRTRVPPPRTWRTTVEATVKGSSKAGCQTHLINEWLRISCLRKSKQLVPSGIAVERGGHGEAMTVVTDEAATLVVPVFEGDELDATFSWTTHSRKLVVRWPQGQAQPLMYFEEPVAGGKPLAVDAAAARLCECHKEVYSEESCSDNEVLAYYSNTSEEDFPVKCAPSCASAYGEASVECMDAYSGDCAKLVACAQGDPEALPPCPPGHANVGGAGQCLALCSAARPCATGTCTAYHGTHVCR